MKLTIPVLRKENQVMTFSGEITGIEFLSAAELGSNPLLTLSFWVTQYVVDSKNEDLTTMFMLPEPCTGGGWVRVSAATDVELKGDILKVTFYVKDFHDTYEEACAKEMEERMKR